MYDELVRKLRYHRVDRDDIAKAADAIEELCKAKETLAEQVAHWQAELVRSKCGEYLAELNAPRWIPVRERLPVIKEGHTRTKDIVVWLEGAGLAIARRCEYHTARNWTWNSRRVTHWLSVSPPADDDPDPDRKTAYGDRLEASFHGESWSKCRLCGKTYEAHSLIRGKKQDEYYCPYCFGYGKEETDGTV